MTVCDARGCMVGRIVRISHTNLKIRIVIYGIETSKKSHRTTGPRSDLRLDM